MYIDLQEPIPGAPNFSWRELTFTTHREWLHENRRVPVALQPAGIAIAQKLQKVRTYYGSPLLPHSVYRCDGLNTAIRGSPTSQHRKFEAGDFHVMGVPLNQVFEWIWRESKMKWGQLILEGWDPENGDASWLHMSLGHPYRAAEKSQQVGFMSIKRRREGGKAYSWVQ